MHDVTVSVWNRFHSAPLISGLSSAGFDVLALGTTRKKPDCSAARTCWASGLLTQASYHVSPLRDRLTDLAVEVYHRYAASHALASRCLWGWSGHHLDAFRIAKAANIPVILEIGSTHLAWSKNALSAEYERHGVPWDNPQIKRLTPRVLEEYKIADFICVPNSFVARTFELNGIPVSKLAINPYGMDFDFWSKRSTEDTCSHKFTVVFAGQFMLRKGAAYLMDAWRNLAMDDAELWIVGAVMDDARNYLTSLPKSVRVLGGKSPSELRHLYAQCDVFILPSLEEGMARAVLEAMAAGKAVIVTDETGVGDIVRNGLDGWTIPAKNTEAIIQSIREAASDRDKTFRKGLSAQEQVRGYTWEAYGRRAATFLNRIIRPTKDVSEMNVT